MVRLGGEKACKEKEEIWRGGEGGARCVGQARRRCHGHIREYRDRDISKKKTVRGCNKMLKQWREGEA
jgi:hypothetical protein